MSQTNHTNTNQGSNQKGHIAEKILATIVPYLVLGVALAIFISLIVLFFYLFLWGIVIGFILWAIMAIKEKFFHSHCSILDTDHGRIIEMEKTEPEHKKRTTREKM